MIQTITTQAIDATHSETTPRARRGRVNATLWALQVVTAAMFVWAAVPKVTDNPQAVAGFTAMGLGLPGMYIIGALELQAADSRAADVESCPEQRSDLGHRGFGAAVSGAVGRPGTAPEVTVAQESMSVIRRAAVAFLIASIRETAPSLA